MSKHQGSRLRVNNRFSYDKYLVNETLYDTFGTFYSSYIMKLLQANKWNSCKIWKRYMMAPLRKVH